jgi:hypothetical protein
MLVDTQNTKFSLQSNHVAHRHALAPILLGLLAPMLMFIIIDPRAVTDASVLTHVYLFAIMIIATVAYLISVFETGEVTNVVIDQQAKKVLIERTGMLAKSATEVRFSDIATVRMETHYDDDGYKTAMPVLVLSTREVIELPEGTTDADVTAMRALLKAA